MIALQQFKDWWAFKRAMWQWWREMPFTGAKHWGSGQQRRKNLDIAFDRHDARKPNCEAFGINHRYVGAEEFCRRCYHKKGTP